MVADDSQHVEERHNRHRAAHYFGQNPGDGNLFGMYTLQEMGLGWLITLIVDYSDINNKIHRIDLFFLPYWKNRPRFTNVCWFSIHFAYLVL